MAGQVISLPVVILLAALLCFLLMFAKLKRFLVFVTGKSVK